MKEGCSDEKRKVKLTAAGLSIVLFSRKWRSELITLVQFWSILQEAP